MKISVPTPSHSGLSGVTADQHHTESHALTAVAHTGGISVAQHGALGTLANAHNLADITGHLTSVHHILAGLVYARR
jgi:hypothetical protein